MSLNVCSVYYYEGVMNKGVPTVSSSEIGLASGLFGASVGYMIAPPRYNLEELIIQPSETFDRILHNDYLHIQSQKQAKHTLASARKSYQRAIKSNVVEKKLAELIHNIQNIKAYETLKEILPKARTKTAAITGILSGLAAIFIKEHFDTKN